MNIIRIFFLVILLVLTGIAPCFGDCNFYIQGQGGITLGGKVKQSDINQSLNYSNTALFNASVGYELIYGIRAELEYSYFLKTSIKKSDVVRNQINCNIKQKSDITILSLNGYYNIIDVHIANIFIGAGLGAGKLKQSYNFVYNNKEENYNKSISSLPYQLILGAEFALTPSIYWNTSTKWVNLSKNNKVYILVTGIRLGL